MLVIIFGFQVQASECTELFRQNKIIDGPSNNIRGLRIYDSNLSIVATVTSITNSHGSPYAVVKKSTNYQDALIGTILDGKGNIKRISLSNMAFGLYKIIYYKAYRDQKVEILESGEGTALSQVHSEIIELAN
tara:strand:- start:8865 stop:9263 length:399 start_codon:yes stop_codon:yes gene_type:complete